jgi:hypothetical protein
MEFILFIGTHLSELRLFFQNVSFYNNPPFYQTLYAGCVKYFVEALEIFTYPVFKLTVFGKTASTKCFLEADKKIGIRRVLYWNCRGEK